MRREEVGVIATKARTKSEKERDEKRHGDCIECLPPWCEWTNSRDAPDPHEILFSIARGYLLLPDDAVMILFMRETFSPVSEGHRIELLRWARRLYDKGLSRCYAVVRAMGEDQDTGYPTSKGRANWMTSTTSPNWNAWMRKMPFTELPTQRSTRRQSRRTSILQGRRCRRDCEA